MNDTFTHHMNEIDRFAKERNWGRYHSPKNLSMALAVEAAELMELYQWVGPDGEPDIHAVQDEIADVMIYALRLCSVLGISPGFAITRKMEKNKIKYPA